MKALILTLALCLTPAHASVDTTDTSSTAECEDTREVHAQSLTDLESALTDLLGAGRSAALLRAEDQTLAALQLVKSQVRRLLARPAVRVCRAGAPATSGSTQGL